jgi:hypothetical protein
VHHLLQLVILIGAALVPFLLVISTVPKLIPTVISAVVAVAAAISNYYKFGDTFRLNRLTFYALSQEIVLYELKSEQYKGLDPTSAFTNFVSRVELIFRQHNREYAPYIETRQNQNQDQP